MAGKHDPNAPKTVRTYKYFNNRSSADLEATLNSVLVTAERLVGEFHRDNKPLSNHTWRGGDWWWVQRMAELREKVNSTDEQHVRWWLDMYVEEAGFALWNYVYDRLGRNDVFQNDGNDVPPKQRKSADQKTDETASAFVRNFKKEFM